MGGDIQPDFKYICRLMKFRKCWYNGIDHLALMLSSRHSSLSDLTRIGLATLIAKKGSQESHVQADPA